MPKAGHSDPGMGMADAVRAAAKRRSADSSDPPESEIPIAHAHTHRGSYTSGFSTPAGARNPSTSRTFRNAKQNFGNLPFSARQCRTAQTQSRHPGVQAETLIAATRSCRHQLTLPVGFAESISGALAAKLFSNLGQLPVDALAQLVKESGADQSNA